MKYKNILFTILLIGFTSLNASLFSDDVKEIVLPTHIVIVSGEKHISQSDLYDALSIEYKSMFEFWKDDTLRIKDKLLPTLKSTLRSFYDSRGFYDATFSIEETTTTVSIDIKENQPVRVKDIDITSDYNLSSIVTFEKNEIFQAKKFISIKSHITSSLLKDGYCSSDLETKAYVDLDKHTVNLSYVLKKGGVCTFGKVTVNGNETIDDEVIKSHVRAEEGEIFNADLVKYTSNSLYGLKAFDTVLIGIDRKFYNVVPVDITVKEIEKPYHFEIGAGYDTYVGPRIDSSLTKYNFLGNAQQLSLKVGWSELEQFAMLSYYKPVFINIYENFVGLGMKLGYSNLEYDGFYEKKSCFRSYLEYETLRTNLKVGLAVEIVNITAVNNLDPGEELQFAVNEGNFVLTYPYVDFTYDARDSKLNPKYGYYLSAYLETGLSDDESTVYYKTLLEGRFIHSIDKLTMALVGKVGIVDEERKNSLPESKYFFAGGAYSNRAYGYRELGIITSITEDTIYGARTWANLSFEVDYPIFGDLYGAVFTDNTMLTEDAYDFTGDIISSAGLGVRYVTPMGPFKLDFAMNVADTSQYGISFQIGQSF